MRTGTRPVPTGLPSVILTKCDTGTETVTITSRDGQVKRRPRNLVSDATDGLSGALAPHRDTDGVDAVPHRTSVFVGGIHTE